MAIASINPATGEKLKEFKPHNDADIEKALRQAAIAFEKYRGEPFAKRAQLMVEVAALLEREKQELAQTMTLEMGKLLRDSVAEIEKCSRGCRYYAENAERFLEDEVAQTDARRSYVHYEPMGPILAIMPWNFPFWQVFRFAAPALMAGNVGSVFQESHVSRQQGRRRKSKHLPERKIPRHDSKNRPERVVTHVTAGSIRLCSLVFQESLPVFGVKPATSNAFRDLLLRCAEQFPHFQRHRAGQPVLLLLEQRRRSHHQLRAF